MDTEQTNLGLERALGLLRRRAPLVLLCLVLGAGAAYGFSKHQRKKYTATASLVFNSPQLPQRPAGLPATSNSNQQAEQATNLKLVRRGDVAAKTARQLGQGLSKGEISAALSVSARRESNIVNVSATATSPGLAASIANTYTKQFVTERRNSNHVYASALKLVDKQLAGRSRQERASKAGLALQARAHSLRVLAKLHNGNVQIAQPAAVPTSPSSPRVSRNTILGAVLGLLLGVVLAFLLGRVDRRIKRPEHLSEIYHGPLLGLIPESGALARSSRRRKRRSRALLPPREAEAFQLVRARLRYVQIDRQLRTLLVTSAAAGDGKTTVARHLAVAAATVGSTVLLLEADLRHPSLAEQFDIASGPGVSDVLIGSVSLWRATQPVALDQPPGSADPLALDVLVAGALQPPNPAELIESDAMAGVIEQVKETYDLVVIDTSPLSVVSDAFPLLRQVDGVVLVGWVGRSRRSAAERLHQTLDGTGARLLGVIANGVKARRIGSYSYDYDYRKAGASGSSASHDYDYIRATGDRASAGASPNGASRSIGPVPKANA